MNVFISPNTIFFKIYILTSFKLLFYNTYKKILIKDVIKILINKSVIKSQLNKQEKNKKNKKALSIYRFIKSTCIQV